MLLNKKIIIAFVAIAIVAGIGYIFGKSYYHRYKWNETELVHPDHFSPGSDVEKQNWEIVEEHIHSRGFFTQGFEYHNGILFEGTGNYGQSIIAKWRLSSAAILESKKLPNSVFGEGITKLDSLVYQISWKEGRAFVYDADSLNLVKELNYEGDGWGLCNDGNQIIMSNGSSSLFFRDPKTFEITKEVKVTDAFGEVSKLNELEFINGKIWANIWLTDYILIIDPTTAKVEKSLNMKYLRYKQKSRLDTDVLNGIAYKEDTNTYLITGKNWPKVFEIRLID